ncbi:carboxypeptidase-like regulatory domain-containing protein [Hymenobacter qilianensis]|uniref:carboxypeptidase-like regulatory domain-containing protein n=1 Tax=Hymenobacter qilianensis TaxID=1385715 RepID=UPI001CB9C4DB|nr:carboxypeptidase-like regulatory domain-containing protein [Hymenobacter qilianensis]
MTYSYLSFFLSSSLVQRTARVIPVLLLTATSAWSQQRTVTGTVLEQTSGNALPGVTVVVKETSTGTATDAEGRFSLPAQPGQVLLFSFIGYSPREVTVNTSTELVTVSLSESVTELAEVVVTGALGIKRSARELGGGNQQIETDRLNQGRVVNPLLGLSGKVAGLRINLVDSKVDPQVQVLLRGARSISGNNAPLYVVDGVPVPNINRLNPNDIESINVLKGANAAALYGSEGVNGALLVTTKTGQRGQSRVSYTNTSTFGQVYLLPPTQNEFGMGVDGVYNPTQFESWGPRFDGETRPVGSALADGTRWELPYAPVDNLKEDLFQTTTTQQNDLSFSGGDERSTYFFSLQDVNTKGIIPGDKTRRTGGVLTARAPSASSPPATTSTTCRAKPKPPPTAPGLPPTRCRPTCRFTSCKIWLTPWPIHRASSPTCSRTLISRLPTTASSASNRPSMARWSSTISCGPGCALSTASACSTPALTRVAPWASLWAPAGATSPAASATAAKPSAASTAT